MADDQQYHVIVYRIRKDDKKRLENWKLVAEHAATYLPNPSNGNVIDDIVTGKANRIREKNTRDGRLTRLEGMIAELLRRMPDFSGCDDPDVAEMFAEVGELVEK